MLEIVIPKKEGWDSTKEEFYSFQGCSLRLEHSLVSISKWEAKYHRPFLAKNERSYEEIIYYVKCMTLTQNVPDEAYNFLTAENITKIKDYIADPMTATWFSNNTQLKGGSRHTSEQMTSELIYYWMIACEIPFECQKWHLNRLLTLIKICNIKNNSGNKKMSKRDIMSQNSKLNAARRAKMNSKG